MRAPVLCFMVFILCGSLSALEWRDKPEIKALFEQMGVSGTFVLYDVQNGTHSGHNRERAEKRFIPASTFKIPNTLIGLSTEAVKSVDEVFPYGGEPQPIKSWENDMSLRGAIKVSNVPVYQELARRIGMENMRASLAKLNYGNCDPGDTVDKFWLQGPLEISAVEQTRFLAGLAAESLPFPEEHQAAVREIVQLEQGYGWVLFGKTGATGKIMQYASPLGWWVGWVEKGDRIFAFALNIDMPDGATDYAKRIELGRACLKAMNVLTEETQPAY